MSLQSITYAKSGDSVPLILDLGIDIAATGFTQARVIVGNKDRPPVVSRAGVIDGQTVTITLTPTETARAGTYLVEVEMTPGPYTFPNNGYATLQLLEDLD